MHRAMTIGAQAALPGQAQTKTPVTFWQTTVENNLVRKPTTIDEYLATVSGPRRVALDKLRKAIRTIVPKAEECISYGMPAFRLDGMIVAGFAATTKRCSYFPFSGSTLRTLADEVKDYDQTKGSLHFDPAKALPVTLVRKLIKARIAEA